MFDTATDVREIPIEQVVALKLFIEGKEVYRSVIVEPVNVFFGRVEGAHLHHTPYQKCL
jgi:hypothetical protein